MRVLVRGLVLVLVWGQGLVEGQGPEPGFARGLGQERLPDFARALLLESPKDLVQVLEGAARRK